MSTKIGPKAKWIRVNFRIRFWSNVPRVAKYIGVRIYRVQFYKFIGNLKKNQWQWVSIVGQRRDDTRAKGADNGVGFTFYSPTYTDFSLRDVSIQAFENKVAASPDPKTGK